MVFNSLRNISKQHPNKGWLDKLRETCLDESLRQGHAATPPTLFTIKTATDAYLSKTLKSLKRPATETDVDQCLTALITWSSKEPGGSLVGAVLACLHRLSAATARHWLLQSVTNRAPVRELAFIEMAHAVNPRVVSAVEAQTCRKLLQMWNGDASLDDFAFVFGRLQGGEVDHFAALGFDVMCLILRQTAQMGLHRLHHQHLQPQLLHGHFDRVLRDISWLPTPAEVSEERDAAQMLLDEVFEPWRNLAAWQPTPDRVSLWGDNSCLTTAHRSKLSPVFSLEGPYSTQEGQGDQELLQRLLPLADHAVRSGSEAVDFFISFCMVTRPSEQAVAVLERSLREEHGQEDGLLACRPVLELELWLRTTVGRDASARMACFHDAARHVPSGQGTRNGSLLDTLFMQDVVRAIEDAVKEGQGEFRKQLQRNEGCALALRIHDVVSTVASNDGLRSHFSNDGLILQMAGSIPSKDTVQTIFNQLKQLKAFRNPLSGDVGSGGSRMKGYLAQTIGGEGNPGGVVDPSLEDSVQQEIRFWQHRPGTDRAEMAQQISDAAGVSNALYVTCLEQMIREKDLVIQDIRHSFKGPREEGIPGLARYLAGRRAKNLDVYGYWTSLLVALVNAEGPGFMARTTEALSGAARLQFVEDLRVLVGFDGNGRSLGGGHVSVSSSGGDGGGFGLSREAMGWSNLLSSRYKKAVEFLTEMNGFDGKLRWVFDDPTDDVRAVLEACRDPDSLRRLPRRVFSFLREDGRNVPLVAACLSTLHQASPLGYSLCWGVVMRRGGGGIGRGRQKPAAWPRPWLETLTWGLLAVVEGDQDRRALESTFRVLGLESRLSKGAVSAVSDALADEYDALAALGRSLEGRRARLRTANPDRAQSLAQKIGAAGAAPVRGGRVGSGGGIDLEDPSNQGLADAVEEVGDGEYEMLFPLAGLSEMQRKARGIPTNARSVVVRIKAARPPTFCIHLPDYDDSDNSDDPSIVHAMWGPRGFKSPPGSCRPLPGVFVHFLSSRVSMILPGLNCDANKMPEKYNAIADVVKDAPRVCLSCAGKMPCRRWGPATCSTRCSVDLRRVPLEVRMGAVAMDPSVADLLLTCAYAAAGAAAAHGGGASRGLDLLPGCPVPAAQVPAVIDSLPDMSGLASATDLRAFIRGSERDGLAPQRESLVSWLALYVRGTVVGVSSGAFLIPSMPGASQFLLLDSPPEQETAYAAAKGKGNSAPVFHGTQAGRLLAILGGGLRTMSGTAGQANGAAYGKGVYCADEPATSMGFANVGTGTSWKRSGLAQRQVLLGCELSSYTGPGARGGIHVVHDTRLLVRYIFLCPAGFVAPHRRHVDTAMTSAFRRLQTAM